jgi:hypothetical protein
VKRFVVLVLAFVVAVPALAEDFMPAPWRGDPGSMYMEWTYDEDAPNPGMDRWDGADLNSFVSHPMKEDPDDWQGAWEEWGYEDVYGAPYDPCNPDYSYVGVYGNQLWAAGPRPEDPCYAPIWSPTFGGRTGVMVDFAMGAWDMYNFVHDQPVKDIQVQITYFCIEAPGWPELVNSVGAGAHDPYDPCASLLWFDAELVSSQVLDGGWIHDVFAVTMWPNPDFEWFEIEFVGPIAIDQVIIETLCYVPEPTTMVLFGVGGLLMIRRRR